jgi:uncharacterized protein (TIGR02611 family)
MARLPGSAHAKRLVLETVGWALVLVGVAALFLPGPGLLMIFGGLAILSQQYVWAERWVRPVEVRAKKAAAESVQTWPRILFSVLLSCWLLFVGVVWLVRPAAPAWWPGAGQWWPWLVQGAVPDWWRFAESWWFIGSRPAAVTLVASGVVAFALVVYSFRVYRGTDPEEVAARAAAES